MCGFLPTPGCYNGLVYVLRSNSGEKYWAFTTGDAVKSSAALDPCTGLVYMGSHDWHAYALDIDVSITASPSHPAPEDRDPGR